MSHKLTDPASIEAAVGLIGTAAGSIWGVRRIYRVFTRWREKRKLKQSNHTPLTPEMLAHIAECQAKQQIILDLLGLPVWNSSLDGQAIHLSESLLTLMGVDHEDAIGWGWLSAIHPEDRSRIRSEYIRSVTDHRGFSEYYRFKHRDGSIIYVQGTAYPLWNSQTKLPTSYIGRAKQITKDEFDLNK